MERDERPSTRSRTARRRRAVRFAAIAFGFAAAAAAVLVAWNLLLSLRIGRFPEIPSEEAIFRYEGWLECPFRSWWPADRSREEFPKPIPRPVSPDCLPRSCVAEDPDEPRVFESFVPSIDADPWFFPAVTQLVGKLAPVDLPRRTRYDLHQSVCRSGCGVWTMLLYQPSWIGGCMDFEAGAEADVLLADSPTREDLEALREEWIGWSNVDRIEEDGSPVLFRAILAYNPLVFHVPADSAVTNLTLAQLRSIFLDRKRTWREAGVDAPGRVYAYERDEGDIAQRLAADWLKGTGSWERLSYDAPKRRREWSDILRDPLHRVHSYPSRREMVPFRAHPGAIGFSLLTQAAPFVADGTVRLVAVDGVEPTADNIARGLYPIGRALEFICRPFDSRPRGRNLRLIRDYLRSEQGIRLIESAGFLPAPSWAPLPPIRENGDCDALAYAFLHLY